MPQLVRFGVSMDAELLAAFDQMLARKGYAQRSEAIRDLVRQSLVQQSVADGPSGSSQTAALIVVQDANQDPTRQGLARVTASDHLQIEALFDVSLSVGTRVSVLIVRGPPGEIQRMAGKILRGKDVLEGHLLPLAATGD
ncbi:MAG: ribbon-helix-helix protein, CopG family [Phycisphaerae bacterium]